MAGRSPGRSLRVGLALCLGLVVSVPAARAIEASPARGEYVAAVDPICKRNGEAAAQILAGVAGEVRGGRLGPAGRRFDRASRALGKAVRQIAAVPRPAADSARLGRWIGHLKRQKTILARIGGLLAADRKSSAYAQAVDLKSNDRRANATILGYGFHHCAIDQSTFFF
jgi:hypothetical protein